ncbi:NUDIX hydrolase [Kitasatospora sp. MBT66]|uniref:NUDIX hydrolase n=1 Tax=Kitasatospora sp. MBT66 TaxID=1444769 RepID=UPI00068BBA74|nr:NUDIX hydrolase [Kitasatospora sp. MBT66]
MSVAEPHIEPVGQEPEEPGAALRHPLAHHPAPLACADALLRSPDGRLLIVDPTYKADWNLPGGMVKEELPADALTRDLHESLGIQTTVGRLLAVDGESGPLDRPLVSYVYAAHASGPVEVTLQAREIREARWVTEEEALQLLAPHVAARLRAALDAERGAHTALLRDGVPVPPSSRDYYRQLPSPLAAATVLVRDTAGRVLVLEPTYKQHWELVGGMVEAHESPVEAGAREVKEEIGLDLPVGRLLVVDTVPGRLARNGRALIAHVHDLEPLTPAQVDAMVLDSGEVRSARWLAPAEAAGLLPRILAERVTAALRALENGTVEILDRTDTTTLADPERGDAE